MKATLRKLAVPAALVAGLGGVATGADIVRTAIVDAEAQSAVQTPLPATPATAEGLASAFRSASGVAMPGVVYVQVEAEPTNVARRGGIPEQFRGTPFEDFFRGGPQPGPPVPQRGSGSGFIIDSNGHVLTNNHVVDGASRVTVVLTDKREFDAEVVGRDPNTDVAVLKIEGGDLPVVRLGDSDRAEIGDWVLALGYPLSLGETVTAGIVSAKGRSIGIMGRNDGATAPLENFIQTDAAINPGNSGGPLIDLQGHVVGMNTAIASQTGFYSGYGFAVPINLAKRVADDLIRYGVVHRPRLGVAIEDVRPADVAVFGLGEARGSIVKTVQEGPAKEAGIELGDVIIAVDGEPIEDTGDLMETVARRQPGDEVTLDVVRYGKEKRFRIELGTFETEPVRRATNERQPSDAVARLGLEVSPITPEIARELELSSADRGVVVMATDPAASAAQRVPPGFLIQRLNGREISSVEDLRKAASGLKPGDTASLIGRLPDGSQTIINYRLR